MKFIILFCLLLASCTPYKKGDYTIKTFPDGKEYQATSILLQGEDDRIKFKDANGTHKFEGSFEVYSR